MVDGYAEMNGVKSVGISWLFLLWLSQMFLSIRSLPADRHHSWGSAHCLSGKTKLILRMMEDVVVEVICKHDWIWMKNFDQSLKHSQAIQLFSDLDILWYTVQQEDLSHPSQVRQMSRFIM